MCLIRKGCRNRKKLCSMILVCSMVLSMTVPAFATTNSENNNTCNIESRIPSLAELSSKRYLYNTEVETIKQSADGFYAMVSATDDGMINIPVGRVDIDLSDSEQVLSALSNTNISEPVKDELRRLHELALKSDCETPVASLFSPQLLNYNSRGPIEQVYGEYNGFQIMEEIMTTTTITTPSHVTALKGPSLLEWCLESDTLGIVVSGLGFVPGKIGLLAGGVSIAQAFFNRFGEIPITGSTSDYLEISVTYSKIEQWTWVNCDGDWSLGLFTQKATINKIEHRTYLFDSNTRVGHLLDETDYRTQGPYVSPHFNKDRFETAVKNRYSALNERMWINVYNAKLSF